MKKCSQPIFSIGLFSNLLCICDFRISLDNYEEMILVTLIGLESDAESNSWQSRDILHAIPDAVFHGRPLLHHCEIDEILLKLRNKIPDLPNGAKFIEYDSRDHGYRLNVETNHLVICLDRFEYDDLAEILLYGLFQTR